MHDVMDPDATAVIDVRGLRRRYGTFSRVEAVRGVSFSVRRGEIFGLIGPDGAGKTSIIQMLAGVLTPHGGSALIAGLDVVADSERVKQRVGYMPQGLGSNLYGTLTVHENIEFFRDLRRLPEDVYRANRAELLAATRLAPFLDRRAENLSGGMRQKLALICTLIHLPDVLLLDEPTTGVDPISRQDFWRIILRVVEERGATVLLSTSYMDEAERCHRIALLHSGATLVEGEPAAVRRGATGRYACLIAGPQPAALRLLRAHPHVSAADVFGDEIHIRFDGELSEIETALAGADITIARVTMEEAGLENVFLERLGGGAQPSIEVSAERHPAAPKGTAIECRDVSRRFSAFTAVDRVNLTIGDGEIFGLLGPNGAGKTTLIKMLCGLLEPSAGGITIGGVDVRTERARVWTAIGYMSQRFSLYQDLSVRQNLRLYADLYGVERDSYMGLMARLGLEPFAWRLASDLPGGVRQRLSLLCAILHHPRIVFLDEPTSGVDPQARRVFWDLIYALSRESGVTVLVSTHYMDEASHCDRLGLMDQARLVAVGSPAELKAASEARSGRVLAIGADDIRSAQRLLRPDHPDAALYGDRIRVRSFDPQGDQRALTHMLECETGHVHVDVVPVSMDETFIDFMHASTGAAAVEASGA